MVNDVIGDFLSRIRNAQMRKKETVEVAKSKMILHICEILKREAFISNFEESKDDEGHDLLQVHLKYVNEVPAIRELRRVSKPGIRKYRGYKEIKPIMNGMGISIFSTPQGVVTGNEAVKQKVGGEYLCDIY